MEDFLLDLRIGERVACGPPGMGRDGVIGLYMFLARCLVARADRDKVVIYQRG